MIGRTVAVVQARTGSTRLPGKTLQDLGGRPLLALPLERLAGAALLDEVAVATTDLPRDDAIEALAASLGVRCVRGSEADVLDRFHRAAEALEADVVVRITADCPLVDPEVVDAVVRRRAADGLDYVAVPTGHGPAVRGLRRWPDGLDAEVVTREALAAAWREAGDPAEREHVTPFVRARPERFGAAWLEAETDLGDERWTVDTARDLELVRALLGRLGRRDFGWRDVLAVLDAEPVLRELNRVP